MSAYVWPPSLPQSPLADYSESAGVLLLRSPTDKGPAKMRWRGQKPKPLSVAYHLTDAQVATLETFALTTIKGTARFDYPHPRTLATVEVRIVPSGDGELYKLQYIAPNLWQASFDLEVMP